MAIRHFAVAKPFRTSLTSAFAPLKKPRKMGTRTRNISFATSSMSSELTVSLAIMAFSVPGNEMLLYSPSMVYSVNLFEWGTMRSRVHERNTEPTSISSCDPLLTGLSVRPYSYFSKSRVETLKGNDSST